MSRVRCARPMGADSADCCTEVARLLVFAPHWTQCDGAAWVSGPELAQCGAQTLKGYGPGANAEP